MSDLPESHHMRVLTSQRLYYILKLLGKEDQKIINKSVASEIGQEARVKWVLTANILPPCL